MRTRVRINRREIAKLRRGIEREFQRGGPIRIPVEAVPAPSVSGQPPAAGPSVVHNYHGDYYAGPVAAGNQQIAYRSERVEQNVNVTVGDIEALIQGARQLGLDESPARRFAEIIEEERAVDGPRFTEFLGRVRAGSVALAGGVATNVAAAGLISLATTFLAG